ncbi:MAG TPA: DUF6119 family protein [Desulfobacterales bacterium]|nr:DUF6119 family protein [Desulfobacterales bacterium]
MRINLHLFSKKINTLAKAQEKCKLENYDVLKLNHSDVKDYAAFIRKTPEKQPVWLNIVSGLFVVPEEKTYTVSCLVLIAVEHQHKTRIFGLTFGYAHNTIPPNHIEAKFGLKVALNILADKGLKTLASRTIDHNVKQKQLHVSVDSNLNEFGFDANEDWLFSVDGKVNEEYHALCKAVKGRDSISFEYQGTLQDLSEKCKKALEYYGLENYKKDYDFIDALNEIKKDSILDNKLTAQLIGGIKNGHGLRVVTAYPEIFDLNPEKYELSYKYKKEEYEHVSMSSISNYLSKYPEAAVEKIYVRAKDSEGNTIGKAYSSMDYLVAELEHEGAVYIYTWGRWFKIDKDYQENTHVKLKRITDITESLKLPDLYRTTIGGKTRYEDEGDYNTRVKDVLKVDVFDKKSVYYKEKQKIEICDFLTSDECFVCVKKMNDSASMSHLFNQGINTAYLLRDDEKFKNNLIHALDRKVDITKASIVFGIVTKKDGNIKDELFFFSQMSLLRAVKDIKGRGFEVAVAKIATKDVESLPEKKLKAK